MVLVVLSCCRSERNVTQCVSGLPFPQASIEKIQCSFPFFWSQLSWAQSYYSSSIHPSPTPLTITCSLSPFASSTTEFKSGTTALNHELDKEISSQPLYRQMAIAQHLAPIAAHRLLLSNVPTANAFRILPIASSFRSVGSIVTIVITTNNKPSFTIY